MARLIINIGNEEKELQPSTPHFTDSNKQPLPKNAIKVNRLTNTNLSRSIALSYAHQVGSEAISYLGSNIGKWSGDSAKGQKMELLGQGMTDIAYLIKDPLIGGLSLGTRYSILGLEMLQQKREEKRALAFNRAMEGYSFNESIFVSRRHNEKFKEVNGRIIKDE